MRITLEPNTPEKSTLQQLQEEHVSFKDISFKKKLEYIWDYHKWKILITLAIVSVLCSAIPAMIENHKEVALYAAFINTQLTDTSNHPLMMDFIEAKDIDMEGKRTVLDCSMIINHNNPDQYSMTSSQKMMAMFGADTMDVVVQDIDTCQQYAALGGYMDLEEVLSAELLAKHKDKLLYTDGSENAGSHAYGIDVSESPVLKEQEAYIIPAYFSICVNTSQQENAVKFLEYLLGE